MNILIGVISAAEAWVLPRHFVDALRRQFPQHTFLDAWDRDTIIRLLPEADVAFTPFVDRQAFMRSPRLRWIQSPAVGVGSLLYPELVASPVVVTSARGIRARAIAEHVLGAAIALARHFPAAMRHQVSHTWAQDSIEGSSRVRTLVNCRMGIVGLGSIGAEVARVASGFGMRVSGIRRDATRPVPPGVEEILPPGRLDDLLTVSDLVVLAAPLTAETRGLIGARELRLMKPDALLINIGRGKLVEDEALVEALREGRLGGAALDVFTHEPLDPSSPYWDLPNVLVTPHTSGALADYWTPLVALFSDNLRRFEAGEPLINTIDKRAGY